MKILVTGATGGLGRELCAALFERSVPMVALGRNLEIGKTLLDAGVQFEHCALDEKQKLAQLMKGVSIVVHSAALSSPWGKWENFVVTNIQGTQNVVDAALAAGVKRFVHISTPSVYYCGKPLQNIHEDSPLPHQRTHYARSKLEAEKIVNTAFQKAALPAIILRPRGILGPHDTAIIPRIARVMKRGWFPIPGNGKALIDVTAVENVCHAILLAAQANENCLGKTFNITNGEPQSVEWLLKKVASQMNISCRFVHIPLCIMQQGGTLAECAANHLNLNEPAFTRYSIDLLGLTQTLSIERAKQDLGYIPQLSLDQAISRYAAHWRQSYGLRV